MSDLEGRFWTAEMRKQVFADFYKDRVVTQVRYSEVDIEGCCHDATPGINVVVSTEKESRVEGEKDAPRTVCLSYAEDEVEYLVARALEFERD